MNKTSSTLQVDSVSCRNFQLGEVKIAGYARQILSDDEIADALRRHCNCDFGEVTWNHHIGNLCLIAESHGTITSIYISRSGEQFCVMTWLDDFDPHTRVTTP